MRRHALPEATLEVKHNYRGWRPNLDSPALAAPQRVYERLFGEPPIVTAVHAGLETAVIGDKVPGLDMISFGPQIEAPHSPDERVSITSVERFWRLLAGVVDELSRPGKEARCADRGSGVVVIVAGVVRGHQTGS